MEDVQVHPTNMAVWGTGSPVELGSDFKITVGAKCSEGCNLGGKQTVIYDSQGVQLAAGILSDAHYSDTIDLYWAEIELRAPSAPGTFVWEASLPASEQEPPHATGTARFSFNAIESAENTVTIVSVGQDTQEPLAHAHVMFRPYSGYTNDEGILNLVVAKGDYILYITVDRYEDFVMPISVDDDVTVRAEVKPSIYEVDYRGNFHRVKKTGKED